MKFGYITGNLFLYKSERRIALGVSLELKQAKGILYIADVLMQIKQSTKTPTGNIIQT